MCRAWLRYRNASGARRTSQAVTGSGAQHALLEQLHQLGQHLPDPVRSSSTRSNAW